MSDQSSSTPAVSVVMSVYNGLPYLDLAVRSILEQDFTNFEFVIVDDKSKDRSLTQLQQYDDHRLKIIALEENVGQTAALNIGLAAATGKYIARQDADDLSHPKRLGQQVHFLEQHPDVIIVGTRSHHIDDNGQVLGINPKPVGEVEIQSFLSQGKNPLTHGSVMFRINALEKVGGYRTGFRNAQDFDYWLRMADVGRVANLDEFLYLYRLHSGQMSFQSYFRMEDERKIAFALAQVRHVEGNDQAAYAREIEKLHATYQDFVPTQAQKREVLASLWRGKGAAHFRNRRYAKMFYSLSIAFLIDPFNQKFWAGVVRNISTLLRRLPTA